MLDIFIDADACPVKQEVYRVAERHKLKVTLVSNSWMHKPPKDWIELVVVGDHLDAADDWIAEHVGLDDIVISGDVPLAARCLGQGALVLGPAGHPFTQDNIGEILATRDLLSQLRDMGTMTGGPPPFQKERSFPLSSTSRRDDSHYPQERPGIFLKIPTGSTLPARRKRLFALPASTLGHSAPPACGFA